MMTVSEMDDSDASYQSLSSSLNLSGSHPPTKLAWFGETNETNETNESKPTISQTAAESPGSSSDSEWDTDIEDEFKEKKPVYDASAKDVYENECKSLELTPASYMCRHMADLSVTMRHHGLGPEGGKSLAKAITKNAFIERLDLSDNYLESEGGLAFANMLFDNCIVKELV
jgi:hypothetical protein